MANNKLIRILSSLGLLLSLLGLGISIYLTVAHYTTTVTLACSEAGIVNCAKVTSSVYSSILGVPLAVLGLIFFVVVLPLQLPVAWRSRNKLVRYGRLAFIATGVPFVLWLVYVELFLLNALCLYCTGVHILTLLLFALTVIGTSLTSESNVTSPQE